MILSFLFYISNHNLQYPTLTDLEDKEVLFAPLSPFSLAKTLTFPTFGNDVYYSFKSMIEIKSVLIRIIHLA